MHILGNFQANCRYLLLPWIQIILFFFEYLSTNIAILYKYIYMFSTSRYLLEQDFPGMRIGPEPTTDSFIAVMYGETEGNVPGNALVVDPKKPFRKLGRFGNAFLNR